MPKGAFNPSIGYSSIDGYAMTARTANYRLNPRTGSFKVINGEPKVRNKSHFSFLDNELTPEKWSEIKYSDEPKIYRGVEDLRLISRNGSWYFTGVMLEDHTPWARMCLYKLEPNLEAEHVETYKGEEATIPEKNWVTHGGLDSINFDFIRTVSKGIRGGTSLVEYEDGYLGVCHKTYLEKTSLYNPRTFGYMNGTVRNYTHVFVLYSKKLELIKVSKEFTFRENAKVEFACGLVQKDNDIYISYGVDDAESWMASMNLEKVHKLLGESIDY
jgi:hypothetical protein